MTERLLTQGGSTNPHELSRQLYDCIQNIPKSNNDDDPMTSTTWARVSFCNPEMFGRRGASEHKRMLCEKVRTIVDQAPVTPSYRAEVVAQFEISYVLGVNDRGVAFSRRGSELKDFERLVGCIFDETDMAIFFEDGGRQERSAYLMTLANYTNWLSNTYEYDPNRINQTKQRLQQWTAELTARYHCSPIPHHIHDIFGVNIDQAQCVGV